MAETYGAVTTVTDAFCRDHLSGEYADLARRAAAALSRKRPSPLLRGKPRTWACGILYALGQTNFLSDRSHEPHMALGELCDLIGVGKGTASAKAKVVSNLLGLRHFHPDWTLPGLLEHDPLAWFIEVEGLVVDARTFPLEIQEAAHREGLIPGVPGAPERRATVDRYRRLRGIATEHQTRLAGRALEGPAADAAVRIGLVKNVRAVSSMELGELAPALDLALFSSGDGGTSLAGRYLDEVAGRLEDDHLAVVRALADARFSVFEVAARHPVAGVILRDLTAPWEVWLMDQGIEASVPPGYQLGLRLFRPAEFSMTTGVTVLMGDATWAAVRRRHPLERVGDRLAVGDRDLFVEAVYAAAVETGALARAA